MAAEISPRPLAIDLFSGLGGWTEGLVAAGWHVIRFDLEDMCKLLGEPCPEHSSLVIQDVLTLHGSQFKNVGLIVSSSPCTEYSYMAMPWRRAKEKAAAIRTDETGEALKRLNALFDAQFRIQREACEASGHHIPLICENVRGAQPWVGRARANFGSYYLFGDVPALMPMTARGVKVPAMGAGWVHPDDGGSWFAIGSPGQKVTGQNPDGRKLPGFRFDGSGGSFQTAAVNEHLKTNGAPHIRDGELHTKHLTNPAEHVAEGRKHHGDWFRDPDSPSRQGGQLKPPARVADREPSPGRKSVGSGAVWFDQNISSLPSNSYRRKAASARIAKIPLVLSTWIGRVYLPLAVDTSHQLPAEF